MKERNENTIFVFFAVNSPSCRPIRPTCNSSIQPFKIQPRFTITSDIFLISVYQRPSAVFHFHIIGIHLGWHANLEFLKLDDPVVVIQRKKCLILIDPHTQRDGFIRPFRMPDMGDHQIGFRRQ